MEALDPFRARPLAWAWAIWSAGSSLTVCAVFGSTMGIAVSTGVLFALFCRWVAWIGWKVR